MQDPGYAKDTKHPPCTDQSYPPTPNTDEHDFNFKLKHAKGFLADGHKVKAYVHFVGRTIVYKERGELLLLKFAEAVAEEAKVEQLPKMEGKRMFLYLAPKAAKK